MKIELTTKEIISILDDSGKISFGDNFGKNEYSNKTMTNKEFDKTFDKTIKKLRKLIKYKSQLDQIANITKMMRYCEENDKNTRTIK